MIRNYLAIHFSHQNEQISGLRGGGGRLAPNSDAAFRAEIRHMSAEREGARATSAARRPAHAKGFVGFRYIQRYIPMSQTVTGVKEIRDRVGRNIKILSKGTAPVTKAGKGHKMGCTSGEGGSV
jgi:hypothetical protein